MSQLIRDMTNITRCGAQYRTELLAPLGLKGCHASYLIEICRAPGISQDRLAQRICINKSNVARQTAVLEEGGFISRTASPEDKRVTQLYPTEKTIALMPKIREILNQWERYLTQDMTGDDIAQVTALLSAMVDRAEAWMEKT